MQEKKSYRKYDGEAKAQIVETMREEGLSYAQAARRYDVSSDSLVLYWDRVYKAKGRAWLVEGRQRKVARVKQGEYVPKARAEELERSELLKENERLRAEVAYLKKLKALVLEEERQQRERKQSQN